MITETKDQAVQACKRSLDEDEELSTILDEEPEDEYPDTQVEIELVKQICPDYTPEEWRRAQMDDPVLKAVHEILKSNPIDKPLPDEIFQDQLKEVKTYLRLWPNLILSGGILVWKQSCSIWEDERGWRELKIVPISFRISMFYLIHSAELLHRGYEKVHNALRSRVWWPNFTSDLKEWSKACYACQSSKPGSRGSKLPLKQEASYNPMRRMSVDLIGPLPPTDSENTWMLVIQDYSSKWLELFGLPDKEMETVVSKLYDEVMLRYGACDKLHSDKGGEFVNKLMQELCKRWGIDKTNTSGYAPWSNGQVERSNASLKIMLRMFGERYRHSWDKHLPKMRAALNNAVHSTTGFTPYKLFFAQCRDAVMPIDLMMNEKPIDSKEYACANEFLLEQERIMCEILTQARKHTKAQRSVQAKNVERGTLRMRRYKVGDLVLRKHIPTAQDTFGQFVWTGPHRVIDVTTHNVKLWLRARGRPNKFGRTRLELRWVHTSFVKPCYRDREGRLLSVKSGWERSKITTSVKEAVSEDSDGSEPKEVSKIESVPKMSRAFLDNGQLDETSHESKEDVPEDSEEEKKLRSDKQAMMENSFDEWTPVTEMGNEEVADYLNANFWCSLVQPRPGGPRIPEEMLTIFDEVIQPTYGEGTEYSGPTFVSQQQRARDLASAKDLPALAVRKCVEDPSSRR